MKPCLYGSIAVQAGFFCMFVSIIDIKTDYSYNLKQRYGMDLSGKIRDLSKG